MALVIRIQLNSREIRCYTVRRVSHQGVQKPTGKRCKYEVKECYSGKLFGHTSHNYDDSPEKLTMKAMKMIGDQK